MKCNPDNQPLTHRQRRELNSAMRLLVAHLKTNLRGWAEEALRVISNQPKPPRYIRLQVVAVRFPQPEERNKVMAENLGIDVPAGKIARVQFKPVDEKLKATKIDGPVSATVLDDPAAAEVAVGGLDGLFVDIKLPDAEGSIASVEVGGDADTDPEKREVITTLLTLRRLGEVPGKAVSLGATPQTVQFPNADQFGVFDTPAGAARGRR